MFIIQTHQKKHLPELNKISMYTSGIFYVHPFFHFWKMVQNLCFFFNSIFHVLVLRVIYIYIAIAIVFGWWFGTFCFP